MSEPGTESPKVMVLDRSKHELADIFKLHQAGVQFLCPRCGARLILALSFEEAKKQKVHPGIYCPKNSAHYTALIELKSAFFWEGFNEKFDAINRSGIVVRGDDSIDLLRHKVYINRNIHGTASRYSDLAPNSIYTRVSAGHYKVVVREWDVAKPGRLESNTIEFDVLDDEQVTFFVSLHDGALLLRQDDPPVPAVTTPNVTAGIDAGM